jgi:acetoin utilization deacetylase AcuC-like enzyme
MTLLLGYNEAFERHDAGHGHPECPERVGAVLDGIRDAHVDEGLLLFAPRPATSTELLRVHTAQHLEAVAATDGRGGIFDEDTAAGPHSYRAALAAVGAGLEAVERLRREEGDDAFLVTRPPGHHALADRAMGFCLFNSIAVTAAALVDAGERVLIIDWDAHHGNGTQAIFYDSPDVLFVSFHQSPLYPGSGSISELGIDGGLGTTINIPLPAHTGGDGFRMAFDEVVTPAVEVFSPTWLLVSCGFDAHRDDPLTQLGLVANDFADFTSRVMTLAAPGRRVFFLEGGYNLDALRLSAGAVTSALLGGSFRPERGASPARDSISGDGPVGTVISALLTDLRSLGRV